MSNYIEPYPGGRLYVGPRKKLYESTGGCTSCGAADVGSDIGAFVIVGIIGIAAWAIMKGK